MNLLKQLCCGTFGRNNKPSQPKKNIDHNIFNKYIQHINNEAGCMICFEPVSPQELAIIKNDSTGSIYHHSCILSWRSHSTANPYNPSQQNTLILSSRCNKAPKRPSLYNEVLKELKRTNSYEEEVNKIPVHKRGE